MSSDLHKLHRDMQSLESLQPGTDKSLCFFYNYEGLHRGVTQQTVAYIDYLKMNRERSWRNSLVARMDKLYIKSCLLTTNPSCAVSGAREAAGNYTYRSGKCQSRTEYIFIDLNQEE